MPTNTIAWHEDCWHNSCKTLARMIEQRDKLSAKIDGMKKELATYADKISRARNEGKTKFDSNKFGKKEETQNAL